MSSNLVHPQVRQWFDQGCEAFTKTFPDAAVRIASALGTSRFYVCPICLGAFHSDLLTEEVLTREHAPPESVGGRRVALTCKSCNSGAGTEIDSHARLEADVFDFAAGNVMNLKADLKTDSGFLPVRVTMSEKHIQMFGVPGAVHPDKHRAVERAFDSATEGQNWDGFTFKVEFRSYSALGAATSWLKSAYVLFFAALGYRFACRPELDIVRAKIRNPELEQPAAFRVTLREPSAPRLMRVEEPEWFQSYAMFYERHVIFLPRYNDHQLYDRLATHPDTEVQASGKEYPWPTNGPTFFHDR